MRQAIPIFRIDAGWLYILAGLALLIAGLLIPAGRDLQDLKDQLTELRGCEEVVYQRMYAHAEFLAELEREDPVLLRRLASGQLNVIPADAEPVMIASAARAPVTEWIDASVASRPNATPSAAEPSVDSWLARLVQGRHRLWLLAGSVLCIFIGIVIDPAIRTPPEVDDSDEDDEYEEDDGFGEDEDEPDDEPESRSDDDQETLRAAEADPSAFEPAAPDGLAGGAELTENLADDHLGANLFGVKEATESAVRASRAPRSQGRAVAGVAAASVSASTADDDDDVQYLLFGDPQPNTCVESEADALSVGELGEADVETPAEVDDDESAGIAIDDDTGEEAASSDDDEWEYEDEDSDAEAEYENKDAGNKGDKNDDEDDDDAEYEWVYVDEDGNPIPADELENSDDAEWEYVDADEDELEPEDKGAKEEEDDDDPELVADAEPGQDEDDHDEEADDDEEEYEDEEEPATQR